MAAVFFWCSYFFSHVAGWFGLLICRQQFLPFLRTNVVKLRNCQSIVFLIGLATAVNLTRADEMTADESRGFPNLPMKTAGGAQFWTDHCWQDGYRLQKNALTKHWRLLDPNNVRLAWGKRVQCEQKLVSLCPPQEATTAKHRVILLHGLMRTAGSMKSMAASIEDASDSVAVPITYASSRAPIASHAAALRELLEAFPEDDTFSFVAHSMGNIITRHLVADLQRDGDPKGILPRCQGMVMLGPPNQGAIIAERLGPTKVFAWVTGKGGMELGKRWAELEPNLATPPFPFHIVAGEVHGPIENPLIDGDGDFVVKVEETKLDGAASHTVVPVLHSFLMSDQAVIDQTIELLSNATAQ